MKFIFIDRDGVINRDPGEFTKEGYVTRWENFRFLPGAPEALRDLTGKGFKIVIISNQAGVGKGLYTEETLNEITKKMLKEIEASGAKIYSVKYCIHTSDANCDCRKPRTGLLKMATEGLNVDFGKTYFIGDKRTDIEAGAKTGCRTILVLSGMTKDADDVNSWPVKPDFIVKDLSEAVEAVICDTK